MLEIPKKKIIKKIIQIMKGKKDRSKLISEIEKKLRDPTSQLMFIKNLGCLDSGPLEGQLKMFQEKQIDAPEKPKKQPQFQDIQRTVEEVLRYWRQRIIKPDDLDDKAIDLLKFDGSNKIATIVDWQLWSKKNATVEFMVTYQAFWAAEHFADLQAEHKTRGDAPFPQWCAKNEIYFTSDKVKIFQGLQKLLPYYGLRFVMTSPADMCGHADDIDSYFKTGTKESTEEMSWWCDKAHFDQIINLAKAANMNIQDQPKKPKKR